MKVLLVWDIWRGFHDWYHVGDEAMYNYNSNGLIEHGITVFSTTRSVETEKQLPRIEFQDNLFGLLKLFYICIFKLAYRNIPHLKSLINKIKEVDHIIISWWGNLNSIWKWHLYFRFLVCFFAKKFRKQIFVSAQTIWPFTNYVDQYLVNLMVRRSQIFGVRDSIFWKQYLTKSMYSKSKLYMDDAGMIKTNPEYKVLWTGQYIGLSIHQDYGWTGDLWLSSLLEYISTFYRNYTCVLIPHVFNKFDQGDLKFMKDKLRKYNIKTIEITYTLLTNFASKYHLRWDEVIENITKQMNMIVATRYHAGVFALKYNVPVLMVGRNNYEMTKNKGLLQSWGVKETFVLDFRKRDNQNIMRKELLMSLKFSVWDKRAPQYKYFINDYIQYVESIKYQFSKESS